MGASTEAKSLNRKSVSFYVITVIGIFLMFFFGNIVQPWSHLNKMGVNMVGIFMGLLLLIGGTNDLTWPSLLAIFAILWSDYQNSTNLIASLLGNATIFMNIVVMALCYGLQKSGAGEKIAKALISLKISRGRPVVFMIVFFMAFFVAGAIMSTTAAVLFSYAVFDEVRDILGYKKDDWFSKFCLIGLFLCSMLGSSLLPFKGMVLSIINAFNASMQSYGYSCDPATYMISTLIVGVVFFIVFAIGLKTIFKVDFSRLKEFDISKVEGFGKQDLKLNTEQIIYIVAFVVGVLYSFVLIFLPTNLSWYKKFNSISQAIWFAIIIVILCLIRIKGKKIMDADECFTKGVRWNMVWTVAVFTVLGGALSADALGIKAWLNDLLGPIFSGLSWPVYVLLIVFVTALITNFFSNLATGIIVSAVTAPFTVSYIDKGINISVVGAAIAFSAMFAYMTFSACGPAPLLLGREEITTKDIWTKGLWGFSAYVIVATVLFTLLGYIL